MGSFCSDILNRAVRERSGGDNVMTAVKGTRKRDAAELFQQLDRVKNARLETAARPALRGLRHLLMDWQSKRLAKTHADLLQHPRYKPAAEFLLHDLYGPRDFGERDRELERAAPIMVKILPSKAVHTLAMGVALNALTQELDNELLKVMICEMAVKDRITDEAYVEGYRRCRNYDERRFQIDLIEMTGQDLDSVVAMPFVDLAVRLARTPAHLAGLGALHDFLEAGLLAFRHMNGAQEFLRIVVKREREILERIYVGHPHPFEIDALT